MALQYCGRFFHISATRKVAYRKAFDKIVAIVANFFSKLFYRHMK